jgi:hypothetical protein
MPTSHSQEIEKRLAETQTLITAKAADLAEIPAQKERILGAEALNLKELRVVEEKESALQRELGHLQTRGVLLERQQEQAHKEEASERVHHIVTDATHLVESLPQALAEVHQAQQVLLEKVAGVAELHLAHRHLVYEEVFLADRFKLPRPVLPSLGEPPSFADFLTKLAGLFEPVRQAEFGSPWVRKRQELRQSRQTAGASPVRAVA